MLGSDNPTSECPAERVWDEVATGLVQGPEAETLLRHASVCVDCAMQLRLAIDTFEIGEDQRRLNAVTIPRRSWRLAWGAAAALVVLFVGGWWAGWWRQSAPLRDLASLYSASRAIEPRIAGAAYGPLRVERGAGSRLADSPEAHELAARIARRLERHPLDPEWLLAKGRLALIEGRSDEAIDALKASRDLTTYKPELETDLASAYYVRFRQRQNAADLTLGIDILSKVLQKDGDNPAALYNRAIFEEELSLFLPAIQDLDKLIQIEPSPQWRSEATERLARVKAKKGARLDRNPSDWERFVEVRLDQRLAGGLPKSDSPAPEDLARELELDHSDRWLKDLLSLPRTRAIASEVKALSAMAQVRIASDIGRYPDASPLFDLLVPHRLALPLRKWWQLEYIYRTTHLLERYSCKTTLDLARSVPRVSDYAWLDVQVQREIAICEFWNGNYALSQANLQSAVRMADEHDFPVSRTRLAGLMASLEIRQGDFRRAVGLAKEELDRQLKLALPIQRSHEFLDVIMTASAKMSRYHASRRASWQAAEVARIAGFPNLYFTNLSYWAELARRCGENREAEQIYRRAIDAYDQSHGRITSPGWRAWAELGLSEVANEPRRLALVEPELANSPDPRLRAPYELAKAGLELFAGQEDSGQNRLFGLINSLFETWKADTLSIWPDQLAAASDQLIALLVKKGQYRGSYELLGRLRPSHQTTARPNCVTFAARRLGGRIGLWRCVAGAVEFRWAKLGIDEYEALARRLTRLSSSPVSSINSVMSVASRLATGLFGDWLDNLEPNQSIVFRPDDRLLALPLALLLSHGRSIGLRNPIAISLAADQHQPAPLTIGRMLVVDATRADIPETSELLPLPDASSEIAAAEGFSRHVLTLRGPSASLQNVRSSLRNVDVLHFAGHTILRPEGFSLLLAPGAAGESGLFELGPGESMPFLVVLSACSSGRVAEEEITSSAPNTLAWAFLKRGSSNVIASYWNVDSEAAAFLMREFYHSLATHFDPGIALRDAQRDLASTARFSHPYFWATYSRFTNN